MGGGITVTMALVDYIPVVLFFIAAILLQRDLYDHLVKGAYSLLAAGSVMAFLGGFYKATWKLLYAMNAGDYVHMNHSFFPMQGPGFLLFFMGLLGLAYQKKKGTETLRSVAPVVVTSTLPYIIMQVIGLGGSQFALGIAGWKRGNKRAMIWFVIAFIFMMAMGYLGAKFDDSSNMHWIAQMVNIISMGAFLGGTVSLHRCGFRRQKA